MKRAAIALACLLLLTCSSGGFHIPIGGGSSSTSTVYRSPERARTVLTAMQTLRYHSAQMVAKACVQQRVTRAQCDQFAAYDEKFTAAWAKASDLVQLWLASKGSPPAGVNASMNAVETQAANVEAASRAAQ